MLSVTVFYDGGSVDFNSLKEPSEVEKTIKGHNGWFEFDNYDAELDKSEVVSGRYEFENEKVTLLFEDKRANQVFNFSKDETASYLKAKGYYFVKVFSIKPHKSLTIP